MTAAAVQLGAIVLSPHVPWAVIIVLGTLAVVVVVLGAMGRAGGWPWRAAVLALLVLGLLNPTAVREEREALDDIAIVIVDQSRSQTIGERGRETQKALAELTARLGQRRGLDTRVVTVGDSSAARDGGTRLFEALDRALGQISVDRASGVILITDGQIHDIPERLPGGLTAPVHVLLTGSRAETDRRLTVIEAPRYGIVGKPLTMKIRVDDSSRGGPGRLPWGALVEVSVEGETVFSQSVRTGADITVPFELTHAGASIIEVTASPLDGELTTENNKALLSVNGVRDRLRVLLVSGEPHAGERVWRNLLKADPAVDLVHFTILRTPQDFNLTPVEELSLIAFPTRELFEEKLYDFDLVIFDRYRLRNVLPARYLANVSLYVEYGGALLIAAGPEFAGSFSLYGTTLRDVLPARPTRRVIERGFRPQLTTIGRRHPVTAALVPEGAAPWGRWFRQIDATAVRGDVIMTGADERPLLVLDRVGEGRVAQLLSDHAWLWARGLEGGGPQAELLRRLAHWLMKEPDLEEEALLAEADGDRIAIERRSLGEAVAPVTVTGPGGFEAEVTLERRGEGHFEGSVAAAEPGLYRLSDGSHEVQAIVGDIGSLETASVHATADLVAPIVSASGGAVHWLEDGVVPDIRFITPGRRTHGKGWIALHSRGQYRVTGFQEYPLAPPWLLLLLVIGGLLWAWRREGR